MRCWFQTLPDNVQVMQVVEEPTRNQQVMQVVEEPTRKGALLDLVLTNKEGLVEDVKVRGRLGCSDHEMV